MRKINLIILFIFNIFSANIFAIELNIEKLSKININDLVIGDNKSTILIEFADIRCHHCVSSYYNNKKVIQDAVKQGKLTFVYKPVVLSSFTLNVTKLLVCDEYTKEEKWKILDILYQDNLDISENGLSNLKQQFLQYKLDITKVDKCINDKTNLDKLVEIRNDAIKNGITGTPTFILNGKKIDNDSKFLKKIKEITQKT